MKNENNEKTNSDKNKKRIIVIVLCVILAIALIVGASYAFWTLTKEQTDENEIVAGCLNFSFEEGEALLMEEALPLSIAEGRATNPFEFTITNTCDLMLEYHINAELLQGTTLDEQYLRFVVDNKTAKLLHEYGETATTLDNAIKSYKIGVGYLAEGESVTHEVRHWLDSAAPSESLVGQQIASKITIVGTIFKDTNAIIAETVTSPAATTTFWGGDIARNTVESVTFVDHADIPQAALTSSHYWDASQAQNETVMAWYLDEDGDSLYELYVGSVGGVLANKNSNRLFFNFTNLTSVNFNDNFYTVNVADMSWMFHGTSKLASIDLSSLNTSNVTNMTRLFSEATSLASINLGNIDTSNVKTMNEMFLNTKPTTLDLSNFDTSSAVDMTSMFKGITTISHYDLSNFDTKNVTSMANMFQNNGATSIDFSSFETPALKNVIWMFSGATNLVNLDLSTFDTPNMERTTRMFSGATSLVTLDLSNFKVSKVKDMTWMFYLCSSIQTLDLSSFVTTNLEEATRMFSDMTSLSSLNISNFVTNKVKSMNEMFLNTTSLRTLNLSNFRTDSLENMTSMFNGCGVNTLDLSSFVTPNLKLMAWAFAQMPNVTSINVSNFVTTNVTDMSVLFYNSAKITSLDLSNWTSNSATNTSFMFCGMTAITSLNIKKMTFAIVDNTGSMFAGTFRANCNISVGSQAVKTKLLTIRADLSNINIVA